MAARAGMHTLMRRIRHGPRLAGWSLTYESLVEMMILGTPDREIRSATQIREPLDRMTFLAYPQSIQQLHVPLGDFAGEWIVTPRSRPERTMLYLHGGGYVSGSPHSHRALIGYLAQAAQARVFAARLSAGARTPIPGCPGRRLGLLLVVAMSGNSGRSDRRSRRFSRSRDDGVALAGCA